MRLFILLILLCVGCYIERDIKVWEQRLCLETIRVVYRTTGTHYDHVWVDPKSKIRYTERRDDKLKIGDCKIFLVR